jgi:hypothetical protein
MISDVEKQLLLDFQRAYYAYRVFPEVDKARTEYFEKKENLKKTTDPVIAELVRRMFQEFTKDVTPTSCSTNVGRALDIFTAEDELYAMTWHYGDNTVPNATDMIQ